jgi:hypothetical protein
MQSYRNTGTGGVGFVWSTTADNAAEVSGSYTQRVILDNSGNLLVGTSVGLGPVTRLAIQYAGGVTQYGVAMRPTINADTVAFVFQNSSGSTVGAISQSTTNVTYSTSSDYRLKENVAPMTGALEKVAALKPCTYTWKTDGSAGQGFIAHELQAVVPDCVTGEKDAVETVDDLDAEGRKIGTKEVPRYQGVDTSFLVATLVAAIQELKAEFDAYKATHP